MKFKLLIFSSLMLLMILPVSLLAQDTAFTYQGRLQDQGSLANGRYDFQFQVFDALSAGNPLGGKLTNNFVAVSNGLFLATLDFGAGVFAGGERWLEIGARTNLVGSFTPLTPRQKLTPSPYAIFANGVNASGISGSIPPGSIANGTITSAMLAPGAGTGGTNNTLISPRLDRPIGTNSIFVDLTSHVYMSITNTPTPNGSALVSDFVIGGNGGGGLLRFSYAPNDAAYGQIWVNPGHDYGGPGPAYSEWQWAAPHHIAIAAGYSPAGGHLQEGIGLGLYSGPNGGMWHYMQTAGPYGFLSATNPLGFSVAMGFRSDGFLSSGVNTRFPGFLGQYLQTNGTQGIYSFDIFADLGNGSGNNWGDIWRPATIKHHVRLFDGDHQGSKIGGGISYSKVKSTISTGLVSLDFADAGLWDLTTITNAITLATTNTLWNVLSNDSFSTTIFIIRARGQNVGVTYPAGWNTNDAGLPATIPAGKFLQLKLQWLAPGGETNVIVESAVLYRDNTFAWDADAAAYLGRLGGTTLAQSNLINNFFVTLKGTGAYTNIDALYPFCWANASSNGQNMVSSSFAIKWFGTINTNNETGVHFDGGTGYGDTGWKQTDKDHAHLYLGLSVDNSPGGWPAGSGNGTVFNGFRHNGVLSTLDAFMPITPSGPITIATPIMPGGIMMTMDTGNAVFYYDGGSAAAFGSTTAVPPALNVFIGARNYSGGPDRTWGGKLQGFAAGNKSMSAAQAASVFKAFADLNAALGR